LSEDEAKTAAPEGTTEAEATEESPVEAAEDAGDENKEKEQPKEE